MMHTKTLFALPTFTLTMFALPLVALSGTVSAETSAPATENEPGSLPVAPPGYVWQINPNMSDEFNSDGLNKALWRSTPNRWRGRPPAEFLPENVNVREGSLQLRTSTHPSPNDQFSMAGAGVGGIHQQTYGYFEARLKASKTKMSTTFWLHSDQTEASGKGCEQEHRIEIDILETVGGWHQKKWTEFMNSNTHYKAGNLVDGKCEAQKYLSKGNDFATGGKLSDDYHRYAAWWQSPNLVHFYFDGEAVGSVKVSHERDPFPFDGPMSLRMVSETYAWQPKFAAEGMAPYPSAEELNDTAINTAYYDYVRTYHLVPAPGNVLKNPDFEAPNLKESWDLSGDSAGLAKLANTHAQSLTIAGDSTASQTVKVKKDTRYTLSFFAVGAGVSVSVSNPRGEPLVAQSTQSETFVPVHMSFDSGSDKHVLISISGSSPSVNYLDTFALMETQEKTANPAPASPSPSPSPSPKLETTETEQG